MRNSFLMVVLLAACGSGGVSREVGARCSVSGDCDQRCLPPGGDFPGGFCTIACSSSADCPSDARCVGKEGGVCLFECLRDSDCNNLGAGYTCQDTDARAPAEGKVLVCRGG